MVKMIIFAVGLIAFCNQLDSTLGIFNFKIVFSNFNPTLRVQINVRRTIINFGNFSRPYFLIWDRMIIDLEMNEI